jgi:ribosome-associated protein
MIPEIKSVLKHVQFKTSRSGGKGGQNVNKVESKVELVLDVNNTLAFTEEQRSIIQKKLTHKIDAEGFLHIVSQTERSQLGNKEKAITALRNLIKKAFQLVKVRKATKPSAAKKAARLQSKKIHSEKKAMRKIKLLDL